MPDLHPRLFPRNKYQRWRALSCPCGAHQQHRLYAWRYANPGASLAAGAKVLQLSEGNARMIMTRLRRRPDYGRLCPECFAPNFYNGLCQACGFEAGASSPPLGLDFEAMSPVHRILAGGGLGSDLTIANITAIARKSYARDKLPAALLRNHARNLSHIAEPREDALLRAVDSDLLQELKRLYPDDGVSDTAARLARSEIAEFRRKYPALSNPKGLRMAIVALVLQRLELLYPKLRVAPLVLRGEGT